MCQWQEKMYDDIINSVVLVNPNFMHKALGSYFSGFITKFLYLFCKAFFASIVMQKMALGTTYTGMKAIACNFLNFFAHSTRKVKKFDATLRVHTTIFGVPIRILASSYRRLLVFFVKRPDANDLKQCHATSETCAQVSKLLQRGKYALARLGKYALKYALK